jgi:septin family protein
MSTPIEANVNSRARARKAKSTAKPSKKTYLLFFTSWILLIATGVLGTMLYTDYLKQQLSAELASQTEQQLQLMQARYQEQLEQLKTSVAADLGALQTKVDTFNELLAFTRDSANSRTDNSNQLYTQLQEVKQKLEELQKNLDVLK